jgi:thiamine-phosphate pyrophosphorylase
MRRILPAGIYGITAEEYSFGRSNIDVVREMVKGGVSTIQYREKGDKSSRKKYEECLEIRRITGGEGVVFIVNDFIDIALAVDADGIHIGQDDLPLEAVRKIAGDKIIGISTHNRSQALAALKAGADYIGVGPIYSTFTKIHEGGPVGLEYLDFAVKNIPIPLVAIGGIKESNLEEVLGAGAKIAALVTEITGAPDIIKKIESLKRLFERYYIS